MKEIIKMKQEKKNHIDYTVICYFLRLRIVFVLNVTFRTSIILSPHPTPHPPPPTPQPQPNPHPQTDRFCFPLISR